MKVKSGKNFSVREINEKFKSKKFRKRLYIAGLAFIVLCTTGKITSNIIRREKMNQMISQSVPIPKEYLKNINNSLANMGITLEEKEEITIPDLRELESVSITVNDNSNFNWLYYCNNLKQLRINVETDNLMILNLLPKFSNLTSLEITTDPSRHLKFDNTNCLVILKNNTIMHLKLSGFDIEPGIIESQNNIIILELLVDGNFVFDYKSFADHVTNDILDKNIEPSICIDVINNPNEKSSVFDLLISMKKSDFEYLKNKKVKMYFRDIINIKNMPLTQNKRDLIEKNGIISILKNCDDNITKFIKSMKIPSRENFIEKEETYEFVVLKKVIIGLMKCFNYTKDDYFVFDRNETTGEYRNAAYNQNGIIGSIFLEKKENNKYNATSKVYAGLLKTILNRVGINSKICYENDNYFNEVNIDGGTYYLDIPKMIEHNGLEYLENKKYGYIANYFLFNEENSYFGDLFNKDNSDVGYSSDENISR